MVILTIICNVMPSSAEAECGALFYNAKELDALRKTLQYMGHIQQATEIITENPIEYGIMRGTIKEKYTKAMDMQFYWIRNRVEQKHFEAE